MKPEIWIYDCSTHQETVRDMTDEEIAKFIGNDAAEAE